MQVSMYCNNGKKFIFKHSHQCKRIYNNRLADYQSLAIKKSNRLRFIPTTDRL